MTAGTVRRSRPGPNAGLPASGASVTVRDLRGIERGALKRWYLDLHRYTARTRPRHYESALSSPDGRWLADWYVRWLEETRSFVLVAELRGRPVGFLAAGVAEFPDRYTRLEERPNLQGHIHDVFVEPRARRQGVAQALFDAAEQRLRAAGCDNLRLGVAAGNEVARRFYRRFGFQEHKLGLRKDIRNPLAKWEQFRRIRRAEFRRGRLKPISPKDRLAS